MSDTLKRAAVAAAASAAESVTLDRKQVAEIAAALPPAQAMESLLPQLGRQALVAIGGIVVTKGWLSDSDWQLYSGAALVVGPIAWRIVSTWLARRGISLI